MAELLGSVGNTCVLLSPPAPAQLDLELLVLPEICQRWLFPMDVTGQYSS